MVEISEIFSTYSQTRLLQDHMITCVPKCFFFKNLVLTLEMAVLECFWQKHSQKHLGIKLPRDDGKVPEPNGVVAGLITDNDRWFI